MGCNFENLSTDCSGGIESNTKSNNWHVGNFKQQIWWNNYITRFPSDIQLNSKGVCRVEGGLVSLLTFNVGSL